MMFPTYSTVFCFTLQRTMETSEKISLSPPATQEGYNAMRRKTWHINNWSVKYIPRLRSCRIRHNFRHQQRHFPKIGNTSQRGHIKAIISHYWLHDILRRCIFPIPPSFSDTPFSSYTNVTRCKQGNSYCRRKVSFPIV